jgi:hypothetical protein
MEIINKVAGSTLEVFLILKIIIQRCTYTTDISQWLLEGFLLKEKTLESI